MHRARIEHASGYGSSDHPLSNWVRGVLAHTHTGGGFIGGNKNRIDTDRVITLSVELGKGGLGARQYVVLFEAGGHACCSVGRQTDFFVFLAYY